MICLSRQKKILRKLTHIITKLEDVQEELALLQEKDTAIQTKNIVDDVKLMSYRIQEMKCPTRREAY